MNTSLDKSTLDVASGVAKRSADESSTPLMTPSQRLDGQRALVVGASSGIGLAAATALAQQGAHVTLAARRVDALSAVVSSLCDQGYSADFMVMDMADVDGIGQCLSGVLSFDVVVNSAGLALHSSMFSTTPKDFDAVMNINVRGAYFLTQHVATMMKDANIKGSIIHISSQMGHVGGLDRAVYCASKHALEGMIKAMAIELGGCGIRINTIAPTFIKTPLTQATFDDPEKMAWITSKILLKRVGRVEDIMSAVVFLAGHGAAMITGTSMKIDGGWTAS